MSSTRCSRALNALKSHAMPFVIDAVIWANKADVEVTRTVRVASLLRALSDPFVDALCVVMYAGRDEFKDGRQPYDEFDIDAIFADWWDYLTMENDNFVREQMSAKWPLGDYLRRGAYMFHIDRVSLDSE